MRQNYSFSKNGNALLEPCEGKLSCTVLRGESPSNGADLLDVISLLPCKPVQWKNGTIKGIALRGGILLQELVWHEKEVKATLLSKINQTVKIQLQGIDKQEIALKAGEPVTVVF